MMKIIDRIILFIHHKNLSMRAFDSSINVGNGYTSKQSKSKASVGSDVLERIIDTYPELNPLWLITGKGEMIIDIQTVDSEPTPLGNSIDKILEYKIERIVSRQLQTLSDKLDTFPSMEEIRKEIRENLNS